MIDIFNTETFSELDRTIKLDYTLYIIEYMHVYTYIVNSAVAYLSTLFVKHCCLRYAPMWQTVFLLCCANHQIL